MAQPGGLMLGFALDLVIRVTVTASVSVPFGVFGDV